MDLIYVFEQRIMGSKPHSQGLCALQLITVGSGSRLYLILNFHKACAMKVTFGNGREANLEMLLDMYVETKACLCFVHH